MCETALVRALSFLPSSFAAPRARRLFVPAALLFLLLCAVSAAAQTNACHQPAKSAGAFTCPAVIVVTAGKPDASGWQVEGSSADGRFAFESVAILNGTPGPNEAELMPDDIKQSGSHVTHLWRVSDYRAENVFARCSYRGTALKLLSNVPPEITSCAQHLNLNAKGLPGEGSTMACQAGKSAS